MTAFNWPGSKGLASFAEVLMRSMMAGERNGDVELLAPDCVRWAVFQAPGWQVVYMLNTAIEKMLEDGTISEIAAKYSEI